jgi:hypothetical protein
MSVEQTKVEPTPAAERLAHKLRPGASGAKARPEKEALIAALKALRHPKAGFSGDYRYPKAGFSTTCRHLKASVMRPSKGHSSTGVHALAVFPQPLKAYPSQNRSPYAGSTP